MVCERAVRHLPGSYKLWRYYLLDRVKQVRDLCVTDAKVEAVNDTFERALVFMNKMPKIWCVLQPPVLQIYPFPSPHLLLHFVSLQG